MAQLSIALAILVAALVCVYAIERIWFHQRSARAASIALWASNEMGAGLVFLVAIALLMLLVPVSCVHLVQKMIFGRRKVKRCSRQFSYKRSDPRYRLSSLQDNQRHVTNAKSR